MRKIRIAQIGTSRYSHGNPVWGILRRYPEVFEIAGFVMPERERERGVNKLDYFDLYPELTLEQVLNDPTIEAVTIETEELYLTKYALLAAKAGKHIHMEKPGGQDLAQFRQLIDTVKDKGVILHIGYMYRYNPYVRELMAQADRGELGRVISVDAQMSCANEIDCREYVKRFQGGMMFFLGCHLIDLVYRLQGQPQEVIPFNCRTGLNGVDSEDFCMAVLRYPGGVSTVKTTHVERGAFCRRHLTVAAENKTVEIRPLETLAEKDQFTTRTEHVGVQVRDMGEKEVSPIFNRYADMMLSFAQMVRGEKENPWTPDYELGLYELILQCSGVK